MDKKQLEKIHHTYTKMKRERGAEIKNIFRIIRVEPFPCLYENTDFSVESIKALLRRMNQRPIKYWKERH
jgi:NTE family protein